MAAAAGAMPWMSWVSQFRVAEDHANTLKLAIWKGPTHQHCPNKSPQCLHNCRAKGLQRKGASPHSTVAHVPKQAP